MQQDCFSNGSDFSHAILFGRFLSEIRPGVGLRRNACNARLVGWRQPLAGDNVALVVKDVLLSLSLLEDLAHTAVREWTAASDA